MCAANYSLNKLCINRVVVKLLYLLIMFLRLADERTHTARLTTRQREPPSADFLFQNLTYSQYLISKLLGFSGRFHRLFSCFCFCICNFVNRNRADTSEVNNFSTTPEQQLNFTGIFYRNIQK